MVQVHQEIYSRTLWNNFCQPGLELPLNCFLTRNKIKACLGDNFALAANLVNDAGIETALE
jgi:hypothetical protein